MIFLNTLWHLEGLGCGRPKSFQVFCVFDEKFAPMESLGLAKGFQGFCSPDPTQMILIRDISHCIPVVDGRCSIFDGCSPKRQIKLIWFYVQSVVFVFLSFFLCPILYIYKYIYTNIHTLLGIKNMYIYIYHILYYIILYYIMF